ncbi:polysaccharide pyruvyl transferase family protein [Flavobacterium sp. LAR06]|uniref:polysaccharide pyruvyl transferase family protein n=1 Tax=Flavobacterium sp. LAR06 TaxID=3064897 RepID=UPI0035C20380
MKQDFNNKAKIENLRNIVINAISHYINSDYVLLDVPNHRNIGDILIWEGELEFLKSIKHKLVYTSNVYTHQNSKIKKDNVILLHGGGNFGDVWRLNQEFRNGIIENFKENRIIIFPQTIHYHDKSNIEKDALIYNNHPDLIICVRDSVSYEIALKYFDKCKVFLAPDMAFFLDYTNFHSVANDRNKTLVLKRYDKELGDEVILKKVQQDLIDANTDFDIKDWPGFYPQGTLKRRIQAYSIRAEIKASRWMIKRKFFNSFVDDKHGLNSRNYKESLLKKGINFINPYDIVYSTRLHGFILSVLLNKEVYIFDNSYGKNKNFFETWLQDFDNVKLL